MRPFSCPYTGKMLDFDALPGHNPRTHRPGKWSETNEPYDEVALANLDLSMIASDAGKQEMLDAYTAKVASIQEQIGTTTTPTKGKSNK